MRDLIVASKNEEQAGKISSVLLRSGLPVIATCSSGAQIIGAVDRLSISSGIVITTAMRDMTFSEIISYLPEGFEILVLRSSHDGYLELDERLMIISFPLRGFDLIGTVLMMCDVYEQKKQKWYRTDDENKIIAKAKQLLLERNFMSEAVAHKYIQKKSMDKGFKMIDTARIILKSY